MNQSDSEADDRGDAPRDLEKSLLSRAREWTDVFPWIRLGRTLRVAGSPPLVMIVALTFSLWMPVFALIRATSGESVARPESIRFAPQETAAAVTWHVLTLIPTSVLSAVDPQREETDGSWWRGLAGVAWSLLIWLPIVLLLLRQGALLVAGRPMVGARLGFIAAIRKTPLAWLIAGVPFGCVFAMALFIVAAGWIGGMVDGGPWVDVPLALIVILVAVPCGILAFGANVAVPLAWAALANERDPDALDSLSRGYEYLSRRPLQLALYAFLSVIMLTIVAVLAGAIGDAAVLTSTLALRWTDTEAAISDRVASMLGYFSLVVTFTLFWSLVGGVYLLLRFDAGGQEVEDVWLPEPDRAQELPKRNAKS